MLQKMEGFDITIEQIKEGNTLTVTLEGRLDTATAPQLEGELRTAVNGVTKLIFDF